jgi:hypothetical protein
MRSQKPASADTKVSSSVVAPKPAAKTGVPDSPAEARGRRTLSTAFVQIGPDGYLTVELHGGQELVLRNVVMRAKDYCGVRAAGPTSGKTYCGGYADVAAARAGGGLVPADPVSASRNPVKE